MRGSQSEATGGGGWFPGRRPFLFLRSSRWPLSLTQDRLSCHSAASASTRVASVADSRLSLSQVTSVINPALDKYFPSDSGVRLIAEPGRYYVASAFTLAVNIIAKKLVLKEQTGSDGGYREDRGARA